VFDGTSIRHYRLQDHCIALGEATGIAEPGAASRLAAIVRAHPRDRWRYGLYLTDAIAIHALTRLPTAAAENLQEAIEYQIDRITPFNRDSVYFDCRIPKHPAGATTTPIEIAIASKAQIDDCVNRARAAGLPVDFVTVSADLTTDGQPFDLLPSEQQKHRGSPLRLNRVLAVLAALLACVAVYGPIHRDHARIARMDAELAGLAASARVAAKLEEEIAAANDRINFIVERRRDTPLVTRIIDDLSGLLPDGNWVTRFDYRDGTIRIVAQAPESAAVVRLIEQSGVFGNARLEAAVRRDQSAKLDQFNLAFDVGPQEAR
jgi:general secretion pathway protein L